MSNMDKAVQTLIDRQAILDCLYSYCRGVDRLDRELLLSAYHPDAIDDHSSFIGSPEEFAVWVFDFHGRNQTSTQHTINNHTCEIDGHFAHAETYFFYAGMNKEGAALSIRGGRYIDRLEKRDGRWRILARKCVTDWYGTPGEMVLTAEHRAKFNAAGKPARDKSDPSYERPLAISGQRLAARK
jgi:hypothetical protein